MFSLGTTSQIGAAVVRVTFTGAMPLSASPQGVNDALNKFNWTLQGPTTAKIDMVRTVSADPFSFDLILDAALLSGSWTLTAGDIQTPFGEGLDVQALNFTSNGAQPFFNVPLSSMTSETVVRQALNAALDGPGWKAFVAAVGYSDQKNTELAYAAALQKNLATATGVYLEHITTSYGIDRKADVGISDESLRTLTLGLNANKVNTTGLEAVLLAYYGIDATVAHATAGTAQPYAIKNGDNLIFEVDGNMVTVTFSSADFVNAAQATAQEVATSINRELRLLGLAAEATEILDPNTGLTVLRIYSGLNGIKGSLRFFGGSAEFGFQFPTIVGTTQAAGTTWQIITNTLTNGVPFGNIRLQYLSGAAPTLINVFAGDYVNLYGATVNAANQGTFVVTDVSVSGNYIDIAGILEPVNQSTFTQLSAGDIYFVRPTIIRLPPNNVAFVAQSAPGTSEIVLAATTVAVSRTLNTAWYLNSPAPISLLTSSGDTYPTNFRGGPLHVGNESLVTVKTASPHGLTVGRYFILDGVSIAENDIPNPAQSTLAGSIAPTLIGRWHYTTAGYLGWDSSVSAFQLLNLSATSMSNLGNAGIGGSAGPTMVTMTNGRVLIVSDSTTLIYDPVANAFASAAAPPNTKTSGFQPNSASNLSDGRVMVIGFTGSATIADIYNPTLNSWSNSHTLVTSASDNLSRPGCLTTSDGYVFFVSSSTNAAYIYSPLEDVWRSVTLPNTGSYIDMAFVKDGTPRGGIWLTNTTSGSAIVVLNLATLTTTVHQHVNSTSNWFICVALTNEVVFVPVSSVTPLEIYNPRAPAALAGRAVGSTLGTSDAWPSPILLADGRIIFTNTGNVGSLSSLNIYSKYNQESGGGLTGKFQVTAVSAPNVFSFQTPDFPYRTRITAGVVTPVLAETQSLATGYMLDTVDGVSLSDTQTTTTVLLPGGTGPRVLNVGSTAGFPNAPGYILLAFGTDNQSLPLRYIGVASATQLLLDPGVTLAVRYQVGTTVDLLTSRGTYVPADSVPLGVTWLTASAVGRLAAETDLAFAQGAGLDIVTTVVYPGDRGLGNEGDPTHGVQKITDAVYVWGSDSIDSEEATDRETP